MIVLVITSIFVLVIIGIPMFFLDGFIGKYSMLWAVVVLLSVIVYINKVKIKYWINWQFIEPFKKDNK